MRLLLTTFALLLAAPAAPAVPPDTVNAIFGACVVDKGDLEPLSSWQVYISTYGDVKADRTVSPSIILTLGKDELWLAGERYDPAASVEPEPHSEVLRWFAFAGPVKAVKRGNGYDLVPLKGEDRVAYIREVCGGKPAPDVLFQYFDTPSLTACRKLWADEWAGKIKWDWQANKYVKGDGIPLKPQQFDPRTLPLQKRAPTDGLPAAWRTPGPPTVRPTPVLAADPCPCRCPCAAGKACSCGPACQCPTCPDYAAGYAKVKAGQTLNLAVNVTAKAGEVQSPPMPTVAPGVYRWYPRNGVPTIDAAPICPDGRCPLQPRAIVNPFALPGNCRT